MTRVSFKVKVRIKVKVNLIYIYISVRRQKFIRQNYLDLEIAQKFFLT